MKREAQQRKREILEEDEKRHMEPEKPTKKKVTLYDLEQERIKQQAALTKRLEEYDLQKQKILKADFLVKNINQEIKDLHLQDIEKYGAGNVQKATNLDDALLLFQKMKPVNNKKDYAFEKRKRLAFKVCIYMYIYIYIQLEYTVLFYFYFIYRNFRKQGFQNSSATILLSS